MDREADYFITIDSWYPEAQKFVVVVVVFKSGIYFLGSGSYGGPGGIFFQGP